MKKNTFFRKVARVLPNYIRRIKHKRITGKPPFDRVYTTVLHDLTSQVRQKTHELVKDPTCRKTTAPYSMTLQDRLDQKHID
jgi:hypothetical protein